MTWRDWADAVDEHVDRQAVITDTWEYAITTLSEKEFACFLMLVFGKNSAEIARALGVRRQRGRQLAQQVIAKIATRLGYPMHAFQVHLRDLDAPRTSRPPRWMNGKRWCPACSKYLMPDAFGRDTRNGDGLRSYCKACASRTEYARQQANGTRPVRNNGVDRI